MRQKSSNQTPNKIMERVTPTIKNIPNAIPETRLTALWTINLTQYQIIYAYLDCNGPQNLDTFSGILRGSLLSE